MINLVTGVVPRVCAGVWTGRLHKDNAVRHSFSQTGLQPGTQPVVFPIAEVQASATTLPILILVVGHLLHFPLFYGYLRGDAVCTMGGLVVDCMIVEIAQPP